MNKPLIPTDEKAREKITKYKNSVNDSSRIHKSPDMTKYIDTPVFNFSFDDTGIIFLLNGVVAGGDIYQRTNRIIHSKELDIYIRFTPDIINAYNPATTARVIIFWDNQGNITPSASDVLLDVDSTGATATRTISHKNMNNKERFVFLFDKLYNFPAYTSNASQITSINSPHVINNNKWAESINIKLDSLPPTRFNSTGDSSTDIATGSIHLLVLGDSPVGGNFWYMRFSSRYSFYDS